jgi:thioredoxin-like negative regulator of GroEL
VAAIRHVKNDRELDEELAKCRAAVVFFSGKECVLCINFERMLRDICKSYRSICCLKANAEDVPRHVKSLGILCVPSLVAYIGGRPVERTAGYIYAPVITGFLASVLRKAYGGVGQAT